MEVPLLKSIFFSHKYKSGMLILPEQIVGRHSIVEQQKHDVVAQIFGQVVQNRFLVQRRVFLEEVFEVAVHAVPEFGWELAVRHVGVDHVHLVVVP